MRATAKWRCTPADLTAEGGGVVEGNALELRKRPLNRPWAFIARFQNNRTPVNSASLPTNAS
ncbi:hypothetical protein AMK01_CH01047 [Rhizobium sp. N6212]|nr:hypothetical protein AMK01_CH01047 [Rhizobium sp. N6212]ANK96584.1 hypothetical protein AMK00_CH01048 [Rhizobium sp. N621]ANL02626.1 hypothetical protein AMJ99_CH01038 [Rhizobium esperanzae]ANL08755.1 hypothetical protein AMJ98_CH01039 [Rhizobium sp. N1341]ANL20802.1 hypothetical protein AMJ96_CH01041 [Rhizobium sp. N113]ANM33477.1 hypothetical protein AMK04_CH01038 [Rhizobium sp. N871]ANM39596.1 hypothetical protein AMK03_CH01039 [Rhizobium sp. N741]